MKFRHRIRVRLAIAFLLVTSIPAVLVGVYSMKVSSRSLLEEQLNAQAELIGGLQQETESFLGAAKGDILFLSESRPMRSYLEARSTGADPARIEHARSELEKEFLAFSTARKIYSQIRYLDASGQEVVRIDWDNAGGRAVPRAALQDKSTRYYFRNSVDLPSGQVFVSRLDLNRERGRVEVPHKPVIRYAAPVKSRDEQNAGIVTANVDADGLLEPLAGTVLVDEDGYYMVHPEQGRTWGSQRDLDTGHNIHKDQPAGIAQRLLTGEGRITTRDYVMSYRQVAVPGSPRRWTLITQRPLDDLLASVSEFRVTFVLIMAGAIAVALGIALFMGSRITKPVEYLGRIAEKVSIGEVHNPINVADRGEIGELARAFERMRVSMIKVLDRYYRKGDQPAQ